ncbi:hypothetical protein [Sphingomonas sp. T9W2]|uniref:hypothetical protein n=1 Tax=Sphingomonas sp. T9W2 TaxID=3143183 RepID=UPI0031F5C9A2
MAMERGSVRYHRHKPFLSTRRSLVAADHLGMTHYVYIATSPDLLDWSGRTHGRPAVKVGETWNPADREIWLSGRNPRSGNLVRACAGYRDWKVVAEREVASIDEALEIEAVFKTAFDPAHIDRIGAGETDIVLLPEPTLSDEQIASLHPLIRDLYKAARSRMHRPERQRDEHDVTDRQREIQRDIAVSDADHCHDRGENEDRSARDREDGWYYED